MRRRLTALLALGLCVGAVSADAADTLRARLEQLPQRFQLERLEMRELQKRTDAEGALALGRLINRVLATANDNPLRQSDEPSAEVAFERAIAGGGPAA